MNSAPDIELLALQDRYDALFEAKFEKLGSLDGVSLLILKANRKLSVSGTFANALIALGKAYPDSRVPVLFLYDDESLETVTEKVWQSMGLGKSDVIMTGAQLGALRKLLQKEIENYISSIAVNQPLIQKAVHESVEHLINEIIDILKL